MSQSSQPFLFTVHCNQVPNPHSVCIVTELKALGFTTAILSAPPVPGAFDNLASPAFRLTDGEATGVFWARISPEGKGWYYIIDARATSSPEALSRCATEIKQDVETLLGQLSKVQSAVRTPVASIDDRQSLR